MKSSFVPGITVAALAWLGSAGLAGAQEKVAEPPLPAPTAPATTPGPSGPYEYSHTCGWFKKVVHPTVECETHKCVRYDVAEEDYAYTKCAHTPILSAFCDGHCCFGGHAADASCPTCGHPRTRKVLIKEFVPEEVPTPKCQVERVVPPPKPACALPTGPKVTCLSGE